MYLSDFNHAQSTHELLMLIFRSEIGLAEVSHHNVQREAIAGMFNSLQTKIVDNLKRNTLDFSIRFWFRDGSCAGEVPLNYRKDAQLFKDIYSDLNRFTESTVLQLNVYPLIGRMIRFDAGLLNVTTELLAEHIKTFGAPVANRIYNQLINFDLTQLIPVLQQRQSSVEATPN